MRYFLAALDPSTYSPVPSDTSFKSGCGGEVEIKRDALHIGARTSGNKIGEPNLNSFRPDLLTLRQKAVAVSSAMRPAQKHTATSKRNSSDSEY